MKMASRSCDGHQSAPSADSHASSSMQAAASFSLPRNPPSTEGLNPWTHDCYKSQYVPLLDTMGALDVRNRCRGAVPALITKDENEVLVTKELQHGRVAHNEHLMNLLERSAKFFPGFVQVLGGMGPALEEIHDSLASTLPSSPPEDPHQDSIDTTAEVQEGLRDMDDRATIAVNEAVGVSPNSAQPQSNPETHSPDMEEEEQEQADVNRHEVAPESGIRQRRSHHQQLQPEDQTQQGERPPLLQEGDHRPPQQQEQQRLSCCGIRLWWWLLLALAVTLLAVILPAVLPFSLWSEYLHGPWSRGPRIASDILQRSWAKVSSSPFEYVTTDFHTVQHPDGTWYAIFEYTNRCVIYSTRDFNDWYPVDTPGIFGCRSLVTGEAGVFMIARHYTDVGKNETHRFLYSVGKRTLRLLDSFAITSSSSSIGLVVADNDHVIRVSPQCGSSYCPAYVISERKWINPSLGNCRSPFCLVPSFPDEVISSRLIIVGRQLFCIPYYMESKLSGIDVLILSEASASEQSQWIKLTDAVPEVKRNAGLVAIGNGIIVAGGRAINGAHRSVYFLDFATRETIQLPELPLMRDGVSLAIHDDYLYSIGGFSSLDDEWMSDIHRLKLYP